MSYDIEKNETRRRMVGRLIMPILHNIPNEEYHRGKYAEYISSTDIRRFLKAPALFKKTHKDTASLSFGTAYHEYVLEGHDIPRLFKTDKPQKRAEQQIKDMKKALFQSDIARALLTSGEAEATFLWGEGILPCKCRPDRWTDNGICVDLKTTTNASESGFKRAVSRYRYDIQAAWYQLGISKVLGLDNLPPFVFVAQEKDPPYLFGIYELGGDYLYQAMNEINEALVGIKKCLDEDRWPGYTGDEIVTLYK